LFVREPSTNVSVAGVGTLQGRFEKTSATVAAFQLNQSF
jgi:hypothetical protein